MRFPGVHHLVLDHQLAVVQPLRTTKLHMLHTHHLETMSVYSKYLIEGLTNMLHKDQLVQLEEHSEPVIVAAYTSVENMSDHHNHFGRHGYVHRHLLHDLMQHSSVAIEC